MQLDQTSSAAKNRALERHQKIIKTISSGFVAKAVGVLVQLAMVPLALNYLGTEMYGLWVAATSLLAMMAFADGGMGSAVINMVAHQQPADKENLGKIVSSAFYVLLFSAIVCWMLFLIAPSVISWHSILGEPNSISVDSVNRVMLVIATFFFANMVLGLAGKVQRGFQEGNLENYSNSVGALLSLFFAYIAVHEHLGLNGFVAATLGGVLLSGIINSSIYFFIKKPELRPRINQIDRGLIKHLFVVGGMFFILQITSAIQMQADNILIAHMLGSEAVTGYSICMKLFVSVAAIFTIFLTPLWPAYREALSSGDDLWVRQILIRTLKWALLISVPIAIVLVVFGADIIKLWAGNGVIPSTRLLVGCAIWMVFLVVGNALAVFLSANQFIKSQIIMAVLSGIVNIALSIWLIQLIGPEGAVYGSVVAFFICVLIPCMWLLIYKRDFLFRGHEK